MSDLLFEVVDGIATVTIDRPETRNALTVAMFNELTELWETIDRTPQIRCVILTSTDCGTFCAGMDLKEASRIRAESGRDILDGVSDPFQARMRRVRVPIIAAMTGHVLAGGTMLSLNCDLRVGLAGTTVGITEVRVGRGAPWAVPLLWMLPQPVVAELMLTGLAAPVERMAALGLVNWVEPDPDSVRARARALATRIAGNAPLSVAASKAALHAAMSLGCDEGLAEASRLFAPVYASEDAQEGPAAFAEKRPPLWKGR